MIPPFVNLMLDGVIICLLAATAFFAARLSLNLKDFRDTRANMEGFFKQLTAQIDKADRAIEGLRESARESGRDLQGWINEAQALSDELRIIKDSGDNLANRLEKLVEKGRPAASSVAPTPSSAPARDIPDPPRPARASAPGGFSIMDREYDAGGNLTADAMVMDGEDDFQSRAERELFEALQGRQKKKNDVRGVS